MLMIINPEMGIPKEKEKQNSGLRVVCELQVDTIKTNRQTPMEFRRFPPCLMSVLGVQRVYLSERPSASEGGHYCRWSCITLPVKRKAVHD